MTPSLRSVVPLRPLLPLLLAVLAPLAAGQDRPKTIVLGFDGMDRNLTAEYIDQGLLPNLARLAEQGLFQRLETSNPAQSPVSWAVFNTGQNPGKTGVGGFVRRDIPKKPDGTKGAPTPKPMLGDPTTIDATEFVRFPMAMDDPARFAALAGGLGLAVLFLLAKFVLRLKLVPALLLGVLAGAGGWWWAQQYAATLPPGGQIPYEINPMQAKNFWRHLDAAGVRMMGVQVASTFPPDNEGANTHLLSGLGVKDISGSPGSWFVYTDDPWALEDTTGSGGKIKKIYFDEDGETLARAELEGPDNWWQQARYEQRIEALEEQIAHRDNTDGDVAALEAQKAELEQEYSRWRSRERTTTVPFTVELPEEGYAAGRVTVGVNGRSLDLAVGDWSEFVPIEFVFNERYSAHAIVRFHLMACSEEESVRLFVPPIQIDPYKPREHLPISWPAGFSRELAEGIGGYYETLGWACMTNPLKDQKDTDFSPQSFLDDIESTEARREQILNWALDRPERWDVYYQVFSTTDRIGHMLYREADPEHPAHDPEYAAQTVRCWGREFPLSEALPEVYKEADRIVGSVMDRIDAGEFGDDCLLLIVADHGFTSFRWGVNLNNALIELGYLVPKPGPDGVPPSVDAISNRGLLQFVDWEKSKAYSLGLGKVFLNLEGREASGQVKPEEYDATVDEIRAALEALRDPATGATVVTSASPSRDIFSGPWVKAGIHRQHVRNEVREIQHDGMADIFLGFAPYYRVSWNNTLGGLDDAVVTPNTSHWSGGHVSVDPEHVPGVFFSNRRLERGDVTGLIDVGPTLLARYGVDPALWQEGEDAVDGHVIPFANLER